MDAGRAELEALFGRCGNEYGDAVGGRDEVSVARVARVGQQHLVVAVDEREARELQRGRCAGGDDDAARRDVQAEARCVPAADALAQGDEAGRVGVLRPAGTNGTLGGFLHQRRGSEVRLADVEKDHRRLGTRRTARDLHRRLGALHHVERLDVIETGGEFH